MAKPKYREIEPEKPSIKRAAPIKQQRGTRLDNSSKTCSPSRAVIPSQESESDTDNGESAFESEPNPDLEDSEDELQVASESPLKDLTPHHVTHIENESPIIHKSRKAALKVKVRQAQSSSPTARKVRRNVHNQVQSSQLPSSASLRESAMSSSSTAKKPSLQLEKAHKRLLVADVEFSPELEQDTMSYLQTNDHGYLWGRFRRHEGTHYNSTEGHDQIVKAAKMVFAAQALSGKLGSKPWPDRDHGVASGAIGKIWRGCAEELGHTSHPRTSKVAQEPRPQEARQILDYVGDVRNKYVANIRKMVIIVYGFKGDRRTAKRAAELIESNRFACANEETLEGGFFSPIIIQALALFLFETPKSLGRYPLTAVYFDKLSSTTVCYVVWVLRLAILGHIGGKETRVRSDTVDEHWHMIKATWDHQTEKRQRALLEKLRRKALNQSSYFEDIEPGCTLRFPNPCANTIDDLASDVEDADEYNGCPSSPPVFRLDRYARLSEEDTYANHETLSQNATTNDNELPLDANNAPSRTSLPLTDVKDLNQEPVAVTEHITEHEQSGPISSQECDYNDSAEPASQQQESVVPEGGLKRKRTPAVIPRTNSIPDVEQDPPKKTRKAASGGPNRRGRSKNTNGASTNLNSFEVRHFSEDPLLNRLAQYQGGTFISYNSNTPLGDIKVYLGLPVSSMDEPFWLWWGGPRASDSHRKIMSHVTELDFSKDYIPHIKTFGSIVYTKYHDPKDWPNDPDEVLE